MLIHLHKFLSRCKKIQLAIKFARELARDVLGTLLYIYYRVLFCKNNERTYLFSVKSFTVGVWQCLWYDSANHKVPLISYKNAQFWWSHNIYWTEPFRVKQAVLFQKCRRFQIFACGLQNVYNSIVNRILFQVFTFYKSRYILRVKERSFLIDGQR